MALTDIELGILDLERYWWQYRGAKDQAIRERFGSSSTWYYQRLNRLIETEDALAADPLLVKRLRRLRDERARVRSW